MRDDRVRGVAKRLGLREVRCRECFKGRKPDGSFCTDCDGKGRLWSGVGSQPISDQRLKRLA